MKDNDIVDIINELKRITKFTMYSNYDYFLNDLKNAKYVWDYFETDFKRLFNFDNIVFNFLNNHTLQGILCYRISRYYYLNQNENKALIISNLGRQLSGFEIYYTAEIGYGLKINHGLGTVIGARTKIGNNCLFHHGVTIGGKNNQRPIIENNVIIYPGAKILGGITIGENSIIGANSVVLKNVPENSKVAGVPMKILR